MRARLIPALLLKDNGLYKTTRFKDPKYIGDPINAIRIFNEKEVDELVFFDISASGNGKSPNLEMLKDITSECFMPLCYGGGIKDVKTIKDILNIGVEKVSINTHGVRNPNLINNAAIEFGCSTIVVTIDVKMNLIGNYHVYINGGRENTKLNPVDWAKEVAKRGAGEIIINTMDKDGTMSGYNLNLIKSITDVVDIPVVALGGAGSIGDFQAVVNDSKAAAAAAGAFFVFKGIHKAVLITYPSEIQIKELNKK